jgi:dienelactone hydrolase
MIQTREIDYRDENTVCKGYVAFDDSIAAPRPAVLVSHMVGGREEFVENKARQLAALGYVGFALDMYGEGRRGATLEESRALMRSLLDDRALLARRIRAALTAVRTLPEVDAARVAAIGFCVGGLCVLDLARSGADVRGVVSLHGLLKGHDLPKQPITAKVLALHGHDDPLAPPEDVRAFQDEMTAAGADWQIHVYGGTQHAFTNPSAANPAAGLQYNPTADRRAWRTLVAFLEEVLG